MIFYFCFSSIASKIRGKVASIPFEQFHKHSANIITAVVFGKDPDAHTEVAEVVFPANNLVSFILVMIQILWYGMHPENHFLSIIVIIIL